MIKIEIVKKFRLIVKWIRVSHSQKNKLTNIKQNIYNNKTET